MTRDGQALIAYQEQLAKQENGSLVQDVVSSGLFDVIVTHLHGYLLLTLLSLEKMAFNESFIQDDT